MLCTSYLSVHLSKTPIDISRVGFAPLYGTNNKQKILALFFPSDPLTAVALYLLGRWWTVDDVLKTGDPSRDGAVEVDGLFFLVFYANCASQYT